MNAALMDGIVNAVLYEGYMLYPYRPSSVKNQQRFNFGVVYPRDYSESQHGADAWTMQTQCLVEGSDQAYCQVKIRFLRMVSRAIARVSSPVADFSEVNQENLRQVERLLIGDRTFQPWQEAVEEVVEVAEFSLAALSIQSMQWPFRLSGGQEKEAIRDENGLIAGVIERDKNSVSGLIDIKTELVTPGLFRLTVHISNTSRLNEHVPLTREYALAHALVSAHTILEVRGGEFVSLIDPPKAYCEFAAKCQNVGTWPILVGSPGERDTMLSSPIILYDYPEIAPESPGDLFDGAEIDEILSLRILTLTDEEKQEMRQADDRTRKLLERTESMPEEQFQKLHGILRGFGAVKGETP